MRPEDLENPYEQKLQENGYYSNAGYTDCYDAFEEGADAYEAALKKEGTFIDCTDNPGIYLPINTGKGYLVFIEEGE